MEKYGVNLQQELAALCERLKQAPLNSTERDELIVAIRHVEEQLQEGQS
jgi:hypothetical protein